MGTGKDFPNTTKLEGLSIGESFLFRIHRPPWQNLRAWFNLMSETIEQLRYGSFKGSKTGFSPEHDLHFRGERSGSIFSSRTKGS